jgi:hypothetical protein
MALSTLDGNSGASPSVVSGTYAGTTATQTLQIGFRPSWVIGWNQTDGDTMYFWHKSSITNYVSVVALAATTTAVITTTDNGFVLAASDAIANEDAKVYVFIAGR